MKIDKKFVLGTPLDILRDKVFEEDEEGRYRERIIEQIKKIGVKKWFELRGLPIDEDSVWKNRYSADEIKLKEEINKNIEEQGYYLWENWLPKNIWTTKDCFSEYLPKNKLTGWF